MSSAAVLGIGFAATALTARQLILAGEAWMLAPPKLKQFYKGGFDDQMSRREAALILGIRESAAKNKVMEAHRKSDDGEPSRRGREPVREHESERGERSFAREEE
jgi:DnaJ family protein C protein 19